MTATTALHAPIRPLAEARSKGSGGLESARSRRGWPVTALRQGAATCATASEPPAAILFRTVCSAAAIADGPVRNGYLVIRRRMCPVTGLIHASLRFARGSLIYVNNKFLRSGKDSVWKGSFTCVISYGRSQPGSRNPCL